MEGKLEKLIHELLVDPEGFIASGKGYDLLQCYFENASLETLRPLLNSDNTTVQREAAFVASELGGRAREFVDDILPLLDSKDGHIEYYAMDVLAVCCSGEHSEKYAFLVKKMENDDAFIRVRTMQLMSNAEDLQLEGAMSYFKSDPEAQRKHESGLLLLLAGKKAGSTAVKSMIHDSNAISRKYGAIAAMRLFREAPVLMEEVSASNDSDLQEFFNWFSTLHGKKPD